MRVATFLLVAVLLGVVTGAGASAEGMKVELLDVDAPSSTLPPSTATVASTLHGNNVEVVEPYRQHGSWMRITIGKLPRDARLVANGVAMGRLMLVMPDGQTVTRARTDPSDDPEASSVASVFALPAELAPGTVLLLHSDDLHRTLVDLRLISESEWRVRERLMIALSLAVYGAMGAFVVIAGIYWTILRERMFADHALYLLCLLIFMATTSGLFYVAFHSGFWSRAGIQAQWGLATMAIAFAVGFATRFLDVASSLPRVARALEITRVVLIVTGMAVAVSPIATPHFGAAMGLGLVGINFVLVGLGIHAALIKNRYAGYFLLGWIPLTASTTTRALQAAGFVQLEYEVNFLSALGALWEALVLTAGIADRALSFRLERDMAQHLAQHDGLTGVFNRRSAQSLLDEHFEQSRSAKTPLSVFFLDIDHFKAINDTYGHAAGDAVLIAIARRIGAQLRASDILGRWGGEEFVVILPAASPDNARTTSERIRRAVEAEPVHVENQLIAVTVSLGVAMLDARMKYSAELVQRADEALYRAKENGRNRVEEALATA